MNQLTRWVVAGAVCGFVAVVTYWIVKIGIEESHKPDMVAPDKAADYIHAVLEANRLNYTQNVVEKLSRQGVTEAIEHWKDEKGLPLPAQFLLESGRLVAQKELKFNFRLASVTPIYVWNGPKNDFERKGLNVVAKDPDKPFTGFVQLNGERYFQAIYADKAVTQSCVSCHNHHPNSPRKDFKLNDVMGGIIITIPLGASKST